VNTCPVGDRDEDPISQAPFKWDPRQEYLVKLLLSLLRVRRRRKSARIPRASASAALGIDEAIVRGRPLLSAAACGEPPHIVRRAASTFTLTSSSHAHIRLVDTLTMRSLGVLAGMASNVRNT